MFIGDLQFQHKYFSELGGCFLVIIGPNVVPLADKTMLAPISTYLSNFHRKRVINLLKEVREFGPNSNASNSIFELSVQDMITMGISELFHVKQTGSKSPKYLLQFSVRNDLHIRSQISESDLDELIKYLEKISE